MLIKTNGIPWIPGSLSKSLTKIDLVLQNKTVKSIYSSDCHSFVSTSLEMSIRNWLAVSSPMPSDVICDMFFISLI